MCHVSVNFIQYCMPHAYQNKKRLLPGPLQYIFYNVSSKSEKCSFNLQDKHSVKTAQSGLVSPSSFISLPLHYRLNINNQSIILLSKMQREKFLTIVSVANCIPAASLVSSSSSSLTSTVAAGLMSTERSEDDIWTLLAKSHLTDSWSLDITTHRCSTPLHTHIISTIIIRPPFAAI